MPSLRTVNLLIFLGCTSLIIIALAMQHFMDLPPCYLCITQRAFFIAIAFVALVAFLHNPIGVTQKVYGIIGTVLAITGGFFSGKQLWLQGLPEDQVPACGPPAEYLFDAFPFSKALEMLLQGDGNCAKVQWTFLDISIPGWALMAFSGLLLIGLFQVFRRTESN